MESGHLYERVYVTPLLSVKNPATPGSQTAMYATAVSPPNPLQIGDAIHLFLLCLPRQEPDEPTESRNPAAAVPLEIWGTISGERERSELEVEFVVVNDNEDADVRRVFLRARSDSRNCAAPTIPAQNRILRPPQLRDERGERAGRRRRVDRIEEGTGPMNLSAHATDRELARWAQARAAELLAACERERGEAEERSKHGQPIGMNEGRERKSRTSSRGNEDRREVLDKGERARQGDEAPGPSERIFPQWLAPKERRRRRKTTSVGNNAGRCQETLAREQWDLCHP